MTRQIKFIQEAVYTVNSDESWLKELPQATKRAELCKKVSSNSFHFPQEE